MRRSEKDLIRGIHAGVLGRAARVGAADRGFRANCVVAEINNGDMVAEVLRQAEPHLPVRSDRDARQPPWDDRRRATPAKAPRPKGSTLSVCATTPPAPARRLAAEARRRRSC